MLGVALYLTFPYGVAVSERWVSVRRGPAPAPRPVPVPVPVSGDRWGHGTEGGGEGQPRSPHDTPGDSHQRPYPTAATVSGPTGRAQIPSAYALLSRQWTGRGAAAEVLR